MKSLYKYLIILFTVSFGLYSYITSEHNIIGIVSFIASFDFDPYFLVVLIFIFSTVAMIWAHKKEKKEDNRKHISDTLFYDTDKKDFKAFVRIGLIILGTLFVILIFTYIWAFLRIY